MPKHGTGAFLTRELVERCMVQGWPVLRDKREPAFTFLPETVRVRIIDDWCREVLQPEIEAIGKLQGVVSSAAGGDFARTGDLTDFAPMLQFQDLSRRIPFFIELRGMPFRQQTQILWYLLDRLPRFVGAALDSRGLGMQMAEETAQRYGQDRILCIQATQPWYLENLPPYKAAFEDNLIQLPMDADVLGDHRVPRVIKGIPQIPDVRTTDAHKKKRHGDSFISGAMAWHASRMLDGSGRYEYTAVPAGSDRWDGPGRDQEEDHNAGAPGAW